jgi:hypothetical protein
MRNSPSIAPTAPDDREIYIVLDDFGGKLGRAWRESPEERTDRETVITDLVDGQFSDPVRIVAFNTADGTSRDVSSEIADLIVQEGPEFPTFLFNFIRRHYRRRPAQLRLPLPRS